MVVSVVLAGPVARDPIFVGLMLPRIAILLFKLSVTLINVLLDGGLKELERSSNDSELLLLESTSSCEADSSSTLLEPCPSWLEFFGFVIFGSFVSPSSCADKLFESVPSWSSASSILSSFVESLLRGSAACIDVAVLLGSSGHLLAPFSAAFCCAVGSSMACSCDISSGERLEGS